MLICISLSANKVSTQTSDISPTNITNDYTSPNRDMWDILYTFETTELGMPGVETDGINIYTTKWEGNTFTRYDMDGSNQNNFSITGVSNIRDMAYDGTHFYGSAANMSIFVMDLTNEILVNTIAVSCVGVSGVRHIAYDPVLDGGNGGFWIGNWDELGAITMSGAQIHASMTNPGNLYGSAYDPWSDGGPYLWLFSQGGSGAVLHQFNIADLATTGITHDASDIPGASTTNLMAGGLATYLNDNGVFIMLANLQQDPNIVGVYEIVVTVAPTAPGIPTDMVVTPDAGGIIEAIIDWVCPDLDVAGDLLTDLDEMRIYRDGVLIHSDTNPTIGGSGTYIDTSVPVSDNYTYIVVGFNDADEGFPASVTAWIGEDVPNVVENLLLEDVSGDGYLTWDNPITGLNGGPFNEEIIGYHITRYPDNVIFEVAGITAEYTDTTVPDDEFSYTIQSYNSVGDGGITESNTVYFGEGTEFNVFIQCDEYGGETTWEIIDEYSTALFSGGPYTNSEIVDVEYRLDAGNYIFNIYDLNGDGICCEWGEGYYILTLAEGIIFEGNGEFGFEESTLFTVGTPANNELIEGMVTKLNSNYPNAFNPVTSISYSIKDSNYVSLEIYNIRGQLVKTLINEVKQIGNHTAIWNGTDNLSKSVSSGVYFYKMVSEGTKGRYTSTKKMILMK